MVYQHKTARRWGYCLKGHKLDETNTYIWWDANGKIHRKCKICDADRREARRKNGTTK